MEKKTVVTLQLKKGDPKEKSNYRPISCHAVASKVLEKIVCQQITKHMETKQTATRQPTRIQREKIDIESLNCRASSISALTWTTTFFL